MDLSLTQFWLILGIVLVIAELVTTTFVLLFFGVAALIVSLMSFLGVTQLPLQILAFSVVSIAGVLVFRGKIKNALLHRGDHSFDGLQNTKLELSVDIPAHGSAQIMHQGTTWTALNETDADMKRGEKVYIRGIDGVKLILSKNPT